jgi:hypothetical protein
MLAWDTVTLREKKLSKIPQDCNTVNCMTSGPQRATMKEEEKGTNHFKIVLESIKLES